jgi:hypothetical protein
LNFSRSKLAAREGAAKVKKQVKTPCGRLLRDGQVVADVAAVEWTREGGKPVPWTGWLTPADGAAPVAAGPCVLAIEGGPSGSITLLAGAISGRPAPFGFSSAPEGKPP